MKTRGIVCPFIAVACLCIGTLIASAATPPLHVDGKYFKDPNGNIVILRGVAMIHTPDMDTTRPGHQFMIDNVTTSANGWYARIIRIGVRVESYLANPTDLVNNHLKPTVDYCTSKGLYCIIDWHYIDDARTKDAQTRQFWNDIAPRFASYENVFYEVFNEHKVDTSWAEWKATAQPWVDIIRSHAPNNIIFIGGPFYSQHIQGAATDPFNGSNLAYVAHVYPGGWYPQGWDGNIGVVADVHPVIVTEWGYDPAGDSVTLGTRTSFGIPFQNWAEGKGVSWIAWVSDYAWGPPMFNSDWTPKDFGSFAKDWLYNKRNSDQPSDAATFTSSATASPNPIGAGATTTITAPVTCNSGSLNNGIVDLEIYNSGGTRMAQQYWTGQNFSAGQTINYTWNWPSSTTTGSYTIRIGVFTANWADTLDWNATAGTITIVPPGPPIPTGLAATAGHQEVSLSWNASSGATSYNVKRSTTSGGPYTTVTNVASTGFLNGGLVNGTTYYYVVSALNSYGESGNSSQVSATPATATFSTTATVTPSTVAKNSPMTISANIACTASSISSAIVDLEVYNSSGTRIGQQYYQNQGFNNGQMNSYTWNYTPRNTGAQTVKIGVFTPGWANSLHWNNNAASINAVTTTIRLNSGGVATGWFSADANYSGGTAASTTATINTVSASNAAPMAVYQTERYGAFTYTVPGLTPLATYTVRLHFAEIYWTAAGQRKFHVNINGTRVLTDYDIVAAAGAANKAVVRDFTATANASGQITIQYLNGSVNFAKSSGIEVIR